MNGMNLIDFYVEEIISDPYLEFGKWWIKVKANGYGRVSEMTLMFDTREECLDVKIGYKFLS